MIRQPPEHAADATPLFIAEFDDAVDHDRIERETKALDKGAEHCTLQYYGGHTRYDIDAPLTVGGLTTTMRDYLREGATPTVFELRRVTGRLRQQAMTVLRRDLTEGKDGRDRVGMLFELCKHGVASVKEGFSGERWDLNGGQSGRMLTEGDVQKLYEADARLPEALGWAVFNASKPLSESEKKR